MKQCTAHVFVFSGRPDPTWLVEEQHSKRLEEIWNQLTPSVAQGDVRQRLGYRGVTMACEGDKEYTALGGFVKKKVGNAIEWRRDAERRFERFLLSTAPQGLLPTGIIDT